jgi:hypothetical protein
MASSKDSKIDYIKPQILDLGAFNTLIGASGCSIGNNVNSGWCTPTGNGVSGCDTGNTAILSCEEGNDGLST